MYERKEGIVGFDKTFFNGQQCTHPYRMTANERRFDQEVEEAR